MTHTSLFIFRRDLRLFDNTGLLHALHHSHTVIPAFIFDPKQIESNPYRSDSALQFMIESLQDLEIQLKKEKGSLYLFYGPPEQIVENLLTQFSINSVIVNRDYTPFSQERDRTLKKICDKHHIPFIQFDDALLLPPEETVKADGNPYTVFTPFFRNALKLTIPSPQELLHPPAKFFQQPIPFASDSSIYTSILPKKSTTLAAKGGRTEALKKLAALSKFIHYSEERDFPAHSGTTLLSAHLKFGTVSPREVSRTISTTLGSHHPLLRSLYWRDFFTAIAFYFPHVFKGAFHRKYDQIQWDNDTLLFEKWCQGNTGFPIVDAGMRELNETGFMHNRVRMVTASFLIKDLHINWQWGERYFAKKLIDYDPAVNNGNWQWSASTGCDAQPYFRIFNPWLQQIKFDPECVYIKKWVPELHNLAPSIIHKWDNPANHSHCRAYPPPIVNHSDESVRAKTDYQI